MPRLFGRWTLECGCWSWAWRSGRQSWKAYGWFAPRNGKGCSFHGVPAKGA